MNNIDKRATELLIENGVLVADTLRHLADNEIDSDYFAICHTNENGTEIECELAITDYARQAAGTVDELVNALGAAEKRIAEMEAREVKLPAEKFCPAEYAGSQLWEETEIWNKAVQSCEDAIRAAGIKFAAAGKGEAS